MNPLPEYLYNAGVLQTKEIRDAFAKIDRKDFVLPEYEEQAYEDYPLPIGFGQTISQPYTVAFMLELLQPQKGEKILDVGTGSAWTTALLAHITGAQGEVVGTELVPALVRLGKENLKKHPFLKAEIFQAEKGVLGFPNKAPFDKILVSAAAQRKVPRELVDQLKINGTMVLPVENAVLLVKKNSEKDIEEESFPGFVFVPLL